MLHLKNEAQCGGIEKAPPYFLCNKLWVLICTLDIRDLQNNKDGDKEKVETKRALSLK